MSKWDFRQFMKTPTVRWNRLGVLRLPNNAKGSKEKTLGKEVCFERFKIVDRDLDACRLPVWARFGRRTTENPFGDNAEFQDTWHFDERLQFES